MSAAGCGASASGGGATRLEVDESISGGEASGRMDKASVTRGGESDRAGEASEAGCGARRWRSGVTGMRVGKRYFLSLQRYFAPLRE